MSATLLAGFYEDPDSARRAELLECVRRNTENGRLEAIHLFVEGAAPARALQAAHAPLAHPKVRLVAHGRRVTYHDLFAYAGRHLAGRRVIIANADIYFDDTLALLDGYDLAGKLLCLSRWDVRPDGSAHFFDHPASQDAWIFQAPMRAFPCQFPLGVPACDNRLAWEAARAGLALANPGRALRAYHLHLSQVRRYSPHDRLPGPTLPVPAEPPAPPPGAPMSTEPIFALTSLPPGERSVFTTRACIRSWRQAGLAVRAFNHPDEIAALSRHYDVDFVPVDATSAPVFGRHFIPINAMIRWAAAQNVHALILNADIALQLTAWELRRICRLAAGGLCYFIRYNHDGDLSRLAREPYGIDAFLFHGRDAGAVPESFLSMGQPFWDYWLPDLFARRRQPILTVEFPAALHRRHQARWSWEDWHRCALEFARVSGEPCGDGSYSACQAMSLRVRQHFDRGRVPVQQRPGPIRAWVEQKFRSAGPKLFLELGAHCGGDTAWMASLPGVTIHAFEPDPRNQQAARPNVHLHQAAVGEADGRCSLILSERGWNQTWTYSSSIKRPKNHLQRYPVSFGAAVEVDQISLDTFCQARGIERVDFIWADIQGAEGEMIRGGRQTLARTRYLYTEYSDDELYEQQITLDEILAMLPEFRIVELWPDDVLLENTALRDEGGLA